MIKTIKTAWRAAAVGVGALALCGTSHARDAKASGVMGIVDEASPVMWLEDDGVMIVRVVENEKGERVVQLDAADDAGVRTLELATYDGPAMVVAGDGEYVLRGVDAAPLAEADKALLAAARGRLSCTTETYFYNTSDGYLCRATVTKCTDIQLVPPAQVTCWANVQCTNGSQTQSYQFSCMPQTPVRDITTQDTLIDGGSSVVVH